MKRVSLPDSSLLTQAELTALEHLRRHSAEFSAAFDDCPPLTDAPMAEAAAIRRCQAEAFYRTSLYASLRERYEVRLAPRELRGVHAEVFTPAAGIAARNEKRVLINLHGGGFQVGSGVTSHLESAPIAALGRIKVLSVDYRMAPEHRFPAATDDVLAVYRSLLTEHTPDCIGIYGCSAGGVLTAQITARLLKETLPLPAAIGMCCGAAAYWFEGDSGQISALISESTFMAAHDDPYFKGADPNDPLAFPARSPSMLAKFPPSLLIAATRDLALSSVVRTHSLLIQQGVEADLHVWEGLDHAFHYFPDLPQAREAYEVIWRFFDRHLSGD